MILLILKGSFFLFASFVVLLSFLGLLEYFAMALPHRKLVGSAAALVGAVIPIAMLVRDPFALLFVLTVLSLLFALVFLFKPQEISSVGAEFGLTVAGFLYVPLLLAHLLMLRSFPHGVGWVFLLLFIVMSSDSVAYYVGTAFGKHKLYPSVSPKKSVEGATGGLIGAILGAFIARASVFQDLGVIDCVVTALSAGILAQLGDLFESLLKRSFGVKDSGAMIPGHGGILDRLDSILFAAPPLFYYAYFVFYPGMGR